MSVVARDALENDYDVTAIRISTADTLEGLGDASLRKVLRFGRLAWDVLRAAMRTRPDLLYITLSPTTAAFLKDAVLFLMARPFARAAVIHLHGKGVKREADGSRLKAATYRFVFRRALVIHLAEELLPDVAWTGCRTAVLHNGLDVPIPTERERDVDCVFLSNLLETKGVFVLTEALANLDRLGVSLSVVFCGKFPSGSDRTRLQAALAALSPRIRVSLLEGAYGDAKFDLLGRSRIFVLPTFYPNECFPLSVLEAMGSGAAVVSTREGAIAEIVEGNAAGVIVPSRDPEALAHALRRLLDDPDEVARLGARGRAAYEQRYTLAVFRRRFGMLVAGEMERAARRGKG
jgi:glycosyltransferase involved in cell wall biosynthesis